MANNMGWYGHKKYVLSGIGFQLRAKGQRKYLPGFGDLVIDAGLDE